MGINGHAADAADRRAGTKRGLGVRGVAPGTRDRPEQSGGWVGKALRGAHGSRLPFPTRMKRAIEGMDGSTWDTFEAQALLPPARSFGGVVVTVASVIIDDVVPRRGRRRGRGGHGGGGRRGSLIVGAGGGRGRRSRGNRRHRRRRRGGAAAPRAAAGRGRPRLGIRTALVRPGRRRGSGRRLGLGPGQEVVQEGAETAGCGLLGFAKRALKLEAHPRAPGLCGAFLRRQEAIKGPDEASFGRLAAIGRGRAEGPPRATASESFSPARHLGWLAA